MDYDTAQRMIDKKICLGVSPPSSDWEVSRRPQGGWEMDQVIGDVLLMHQVGMARRQRRFSTNDEGEGGKSGGALSLHRTKLSFQLDGKGNPARVAAYPIKDSNR